MLGYWEMARCYRNTAPGREPAQAVEAPADGPDGKQRTRGYKEGGRAMASTELTVGQLAERSGVAVSALHFYERQGLISSRRTPGNQRRFDRSMLRRVAVIRAAQRAGIPLAVIAEAFSQLPADGVPDQADWQRLSAAWRRELDDRIHRLEALRDRLGGCIGCGCLSLAECRFVNPDDAARGTGSRVLE